MSVSNNRTQQPSTLAFQADTHTSYAPQSPLADWQIDALQRLTQDAPILVTDDDRMSRMYYQALLNQQFGFALLETSDPAAALAICQERPVSLVISCLLKPQGMDGLTLAETMKDDSRTRQIPLLVISASYNAETLALDAGADAFLGKPCHPQQILHQVWLLLRPQIL